MTVTRLVGDIGGTNARFALCTPGGLPREERKLAVADYPGPVEAARAYLAGRAVEEAVLAVATPVLGDAVAFTNSPWRFSIRAAEAALGVRHLAVINDFAAQAAALPLLEEADLAVLKPGQSRAEAPRLVLGPGTGLGVAWLLPEGGRLRILPSEGGHASFAPQDEEQDDVLRRLRRRHGGHVSAERLISGPGLLHLAQALAERAGQDLPLAGPPDVTRRAASGECPVSARAVSLFCEILGGVAGNLALSLLAQGGVYVAGGLMRGLGPLLDRAALARGFTGKGRFAGYLDGIPITQMLRPHTGLLGAAAYQG
ncbi:glucokinase [Roseomonas sp. GC11]|uniref:glucokinase n=1 Tax=Roseomonas sp. GC11 TaxID=2950546 RepID=UPI00210D1D80|nr:glucokinase [Roseomonas sp. GC11]MCQ4159707.1 glucokinase [Roseomonas sp. GC11]